MLSNDDRQFRNNKPSQVNWITVNNNVRQILFKTRYFKMKVCRIAVRLNPYKTKFLFLFSSKLNENTRS